MPARHRPARAPFRAIAIVAAEERRRHLVAVGINCAVAAILAAGLAIAAL